MVSMLVKVDINEVHKSSAIVCFACEKQIILKWTVAVEQIGAKRICNYGNAFVTKQSIPIAMIGLHYSKIQYECSDKICFLGNLCQT
jgi:hypothetical protein